MNVSFQQIRKKQPQPKSGKELIIACPPMKSNCNISMIVRSASCFGASTIIVTGQNKVDKHISRECDIGVKYHRSLLPVLNEYKRQDYKIIGIEQATNSKNIYDYFFEHIPTVLVVGNECGGMPEDVLNYMEEVIEIPLFGKPSSLNVGIAASVCLFEYAKQCHYEE